MLRNKCWDQVWELVVLKLGGFRVCRGAGAQAFRERRGMQCRRIILLRSRVRGRFSMGLVETTQSHHFLCLISQTSSAWRVIIRVLKRFLKELTTCDLPCKRLTRRQALLQVHLVCVCVFLLVFLACLLPFFADWGVQASQILC